MKDKKEISEEEFLSKYDSNIFNKPSVAVDMLIFTVLDKETNNYRRLPEKKLSILLIKRGEHPYKGKWALPGGFVGIDESLDEAAIRELKTETNVEDIYMEQLYTHGKVNRDPRTRVISCAYMALVDSVDISLKAGEDAKDARWFEVKHEILEENKNEKLVLLSFINDELILKTKVKITENNVNRRKVITREVIESNDLAFDHGEFIEYAIERLQNKIEYTDIAFNLMPELFTLTELQKVYESILDKQLLTAAFRRKINDMVIETNEQTKEGGHRPSKLYKFNSEWDKK